MKPVIETISKNVEIHCKRCDYKGEITTTQVYYTFCPNCDELVYVGHLTQDRD